MKDNVIPLEYVKFEQKLSDAKCVRLKILLGTIVFRKLIQNEYLLVCSLIQS